MIRNWPKKIVVIFLLLVLPGTIFAYPRPPGEWTGWLVLDPWGSMYFFNDCYIYPINQQIVPELMRYAGKPCVLEVQKTYQLVTPGTSQITEAAYRRAPVFGELKDLSLQAEISTQTKDQNRLQITLTMKNTTSHKVRFALEQLTILALQRGKSYLFTVTNGFSFPVNFYSSRYISHKDVIEQRGQVRGWTGYTPLLFGEEYSVTLRLHLKPGDYYLWGSYSDFSGPDSLMSNGIELSIPKKMKLTETIDIDQICKHGEFANKKIKLVKVLFPWRTEEDITRAQKYYPDGFPSVTALAISPDGNEYAWGDQGGNIFLWRQDSDQMVSIRDSTVRRPKAVKRNVEQERQQLFLDFDRQFTKKHKRFPTQEEHLAFRKTIHLDPNAIFTNPLIPPTQIEAIRFTANDTIYWLDSNKNVWKTVLLAGDIVSTTKINPQQVPWTPGTEAEPSLVSSTWEKNQEGYLWIGVSRYNIKSYRWKGPRVQAVLTDQNQKRICLGCEDGTVRLFALPTK